MGRRRNLVSKESRETPVEPVETIEPVAQVAPIVEPEIKKEEPVKVIVRPVLMLEEIARTYKNFKPHHLPAIVSFFQSKGFALRGMEEQLEQGLEAFGWKKSLRSKPR